MVRMSLEHHFNDTLYKSSELVDPVPPPQRIPSIDEASTVIMILFGTSGELST